MRLVFLIRSHLTPIALAYSLARHRSIRADCEVTAQQFFLQHKYKTVIGPMPMPLPTAVTNLELPSFMARKEEFVRPVSFSPDGCSMTFGAINGVAPAFTLTRAAANASSTSESEPGIK